MDFMDYVLNALPVLDLKEQYQKEADDHKQRKNYLLDYVKIIAVFAQYVTAEDAQRIKKKLREMDIKEQPLYVLDKIIADKKNQVPSLRSEQDRGREI